MSLDVSLTLFIYWALIKLVNKDVLLIANIQFFSIIPQFPLSIFKTIGLVFAIVYVFEFAGDATKKVWLEED